MKIKRATNPEYREDERKKGLTRMTKARTINRKNGTIYLLDRMRIPVMYWNFKEAYPVKYTGPDLRADSANIAFESVELTHRGLSRPALGGMLGAAGSAVAGLAGSVSVSVGL